MNMYRITNLDSLAPGVDLIAADENDAARAYAWRVHGFAGRFVALARESFVPAFGCVGWHTEIRGPEHTEMNLSIVVRIRDCVVHR